MSTLLDKVIHVASEVGNSIVDTAKEAAESVVDTAKEAAESVVDTAKEAAEKAAKRSAKRAIEKAAKLAEKQEKQRQKEAEESGYYIRDGKLIVSTMEGMKTWLTELGKDTTPALMQTLQTQLQVLKYVQSPSMTGMALDNMILCMDKAAKTSTNTQELANIKEAFASMIQNYFFMLEANLKCAQKKSQHESVQLLTQAGEMLSDAVTKTAMALSSAGTASVADVVVKNVFESPEMQRGYLKKLFTWIGDKKVLTQKEEEFYKTIEMLFETFDENSELLGKSILYNGMLSRYRNMLVERYKEQKMKMYLARGYKIDTDKLNELSNGLKSVAKSAVGINKLNALTGLTQSLTSAARLLADWINHSNKLCDIAAYCDMQDALGNECKRLQEQFDEEDALLAKLKAEQKQAGFFNFSEKKALQEKIDRKKEERDTVYEVLRLTKEQINKMRQMFPDSYAMKADIEAYESNLRRIEQKF